MKKVILHIGFGKTGSSTIQTFLSQQPELLGKSNYEYCVVKDDGSVIGSEEIRQTSLKNAFGYLSSAIAIHGAEFQVDRMRSGLQSILDRGLVPIMSQEFWADDKKSFQASNILRKLGFEFEVIAYVRPQVDYLNSGWWQWWYWERKYPSVLALALAYGDYFSWYKALSIWKNLESVSKLRVRLHSTDVLADFLSVLGVSSEGLEAKNLRANVALSLSLAKLYEAIPSLRQIHYSVNDNILSPIILDDKKVPWVIDMSDTKKLIEMYRSGNEALLELVDNDVVSLMSNDQKWWHSDAYSSKFSEAEDWHSKIQMSRDDAVDILKNIVPAFITYRRRGLI
jgi:hypothetical protein